MLYYFLNLTFQQSSFNINVLGEKKERKGNVLVKTANHTCNISNKAFFFIVNFSFSHLSIF